MQLNILEKQGQSKYKTSTKKEIIKFREEINEIETYLYVTFHPHTWKYETLILFL